MNIQVKTIIIYFENKTATVQYKILDSKREKKYSKDC